jgi:hypothetical protein
MWVYFFMDQFKIIKSNHGGALSIASHYIISCRHSALQVKKTVI